MMAFFVFRRLRAFAIVILSLLEPSGVGRMEGQIASSMGVSSSSPKSKTLSTHCGGKDGLESAGGTNVGPIYVVKCHI